MSGEALRKKREESGQDLKDVSDILRIKYEYLKAIEDEEFEKIPAPVYAKGFLRQYAAFLNADTDAALKAYMDKIAQQKETTPAPPADSAKSSKNILYIQMVIILAITGIYFLFTVKTGEKAGGPDKTTFTKAQAITNLPVSDFFSPDLKSNKEAQQKGHSLDVTATDTTWLSIRIDGTHQKQMLLRKGETANFSAMESFSIKIGNAGGAKIVFDGKEAGQLGEKGQVVNLTLPTYPENAFSSGMVDPVRESKQTKNAVSNGVD